MGILDLKLINTQSKTWVALHRVNETNTGICVAICQVPEVISDTDGNSGENMFCLLYRKYN